MSDRPERRDRLEWFTALAGSVIEAWAELRVHRGRVLLSLIGVAVAVCALTVVSGLGSILQQSTTESFERSGGRPATLVMQAAGGSGSTVSADEVSRAFADVVQRYGVTYWTRNTYGSVPVQLIDGVSQVQTEAVDPDYGTMHLVQMTDGVWFADTDARRLAPALVVNPAMYARMGKPDLRSHPTVMLEGRSPVTAVVIGVASGNFGSEPGMYMLYQAYADQQSAKSVDENPARFEAWVPPAAATELKTSMTQDIDAALGLSGRNSVTMNRQDYQAYNQSDPLLPLRIGVGGVAVLILLLGALSLLTVSLVTVRQRIREIGIRRSFGATAPRVFFSVMMESVVATGFAGVIGVAVAIFVVQNPFVRDKLAQGATDLPGFPVGAAVLGIVVSVAIGALAGLVPALVAVRVKVIDAIRY